MKTYSPKFRCAVDPSDLELWGNYDTDTTKNLLIVFDKCDNKTAAIPCKSEEEIAEWMNDKFILVAKNEKKFITYKIDNEERVESSVVLGWHAMNPTTRSEYVYMLFRTHF